MLAPSADTRCPVCLHPQSAFLCRFCVQSGSFTHSTAPGDHTYTSLRLNCERLSHQLVASAVQAEHIMERVAALAAAQQKHGHVSACVTRLERARVTLTAECETLRERVHSVSLRRMHAQDGAEYIRAQIGRIRERGAVIVEAAAQKQEAAAGLARHTRCVSDRLVHTLQHSIFPLRVTQTVATSGGGQGRLRTETQMALQEAQDVTYVAGSGWTVDHSVIEERDSSRVSVAGCEAVAENRLLGPSHAEWRATNAVFAHSAHLVRVLAHIWHVQLPRALLSDVFDTSAATPLEGTAQTPQYGSGGGGTVEEAQTLQRVEHARLSLLIDVLHMCTCRGVCAASLHALQPLTSLQQLLAQQQVPAETGATHRCHQCRPQLDWCLLERCARDPVTERHLWLADPANRPATSKRRATVARVGECAVITPPSPPSAAGIVDNLLSLFRKQSM